MKKIKSSTQSTGNQQTHLTAKPVDSTNNQTNQIDNELSTFSELMNLLASCSLSEQNSLDDKIDISLLQFQVLEIHNFNDERMNKMNKKFKDDLTERNNKWHQLNNYLDKIIDQIINIECDINGSNLRTQIAFKKKMRYLNFLLKSAKRSLSAKSLKNFLSRCNQDGLAYSIAMSKHHFEVNAYKNVKYDLDSLAKLARRVENELKQLNVEFESDVYWDNFSSINRTNDFPNDQTIFTYPTSIDQIVMKSSPFSLQNENQTNDEEVNEVYAAKQLKKVISNVNYLKSKAKSSIELELSENKSFNFLFDQSPNIVEQLNPHNSELISKKEIDINNASLQKISKKIDSNKCQDAFKNIMGKSVNDIDSNEYFDDLFLDQLFVESPPFADKETKEIDSCHYQAMIIDEQIELDLSIGSKQKNLDLSTRHIDDSKNEQQFTLNDTSNSDVKYGSNNYRVDLSSKSSRFFTDQSNESVIRKKTQQETQNKEDTENKNDCYFKSGLSSQILFN